jgi:hypothetical protein
MKPTLFTVVTQPELILSRLGRLIAPIRSKILSP